MPIDGCDRVLPFFKIKHVPPLTALAASVYATMLLPGDEHDVDRLACAQAICLDWRARYGDGGIEDDLLVVRRELFALLNFTRRISFDKLIALRSEATSAAHILKFALLLDMDADTTSSIGKAVALTLKYVPVEKRTLMNRWAQFKGVAHLWAAYSDFCGALEEVGPEWGITAWLSFMKDPRPILAIAKSYRDWAIQHVPSGSKSVSTLDSNSTWSIPESFGPLPTAEFLNRESLYCGLTPKARELLDAYRRR